MDKTPLPEYFKPIELSPSIQKILDNVQPILTYQNNMSNLPIPEMVKIPPPEERFKFMTDRLDSMQDELKHQTTELQRLEYENKKLNAQITTQNKVIDKQLSELEEQKSINTNLQQINNTLVENNKHSFRDGILIGLIPSVIILVITVILTYYGWL